VSRSAPERKDGMANSEGVQRDEAAAGRRPAVRDLPADTFGIIRVGERNA